MTDSERGAMVVAAATAPAAETVDAATLDRSLVRSIAWTGAVKWTVQLLTWASTFLVARMLTPADYGLVGMATVFLGLVTLISEFGLSITVVTLRDLSDEQVSQLNTVSILLGLFCFVVSCAAAVPLSWFFRAPALPPVVAVLGLGFLLNAFRIVPSSLLQRELRFKLLALLEGVQGVVLALAMVAFAWLGLRYWTLVIGQLLGGAVLTAGTLYFRRHAFRWPRLDSLRAALTFTRHQLLGNLAWYTYSNADFLVAGRLLGEAQLGIYTFGWSLAITFPEKVTSLIMRVTPAFFSAVQHDPAALRRYLLKLTETLSLLSFPALIGLALVADDLVAVALGEAWQGVVGPLRLLALYAAYDSVTQLLSRVLTVTGEVRFLMWVGIALALLMPIGFVIGSRWGPIGIAGTWLVIHPFTRIPVLRRMRRRLDLPIRTYLGAFGPAAEASLVMVGAVVLLKLQVAAGLPPIARLLVQAAGGALAYGGALLLRHRLRLEGAMQLMRSAARETD